MAGHSSETTATDVLAACHNQQIRLVVNTTASPFRDKSVVLRPYDASRKEL